ncbi:hypothetical protein BMBphi_gp020 [Bacillus phage vB_BthS_BMBphi]|nr:hypothetical protein BMBphi_gp020 [Bacillus phage vB_BthS_BMBphi]
MKNQMGFTAEIKKTDEIVSVEKKKVSTWKNLIIGGGVILTLVGGIGSCTVNLISEREAKKEQLSAEYAQEKSLKDASKSEKKASEPTMAEWKENGRITKEMTNGTAISRATTIVDTFNKEIKSTPEYSIFGFEFSSKGGQLYLTVDVDKASQHFGVDETTTKLGISQGSDVYVSYVNRFNAKENKNSSLQIVDKHGKLIVEVK